MAVTVPAVATLPSDVFIERILRWLEADNLMHEFRGYAIQDVFVIQERGKMGGVEVTTQDHVINTRINFIGGQNE